VISSCGQVDWVYYHDQSIKTTCKNKDWYQVDAILPMLFVASYSYNKTRVNTHVTVIKLSFGCFLIKSQTVQKSGQMTI